MYLDYHNDVRRFNKMYELECNEQPTFLGIDQFKNFQHILQEELEEGVEILGLMHGGDEDDAMVDMADWLGDIIVYCSTQARRCGINLKPVVKAIMESNFSKLGEDGEPIKDERGKITKGPNFVGPEDKIRAILFGE